MRKNYRNSPSSAPVSRRQFLKGATAATGALLLGGIGRAQTVSTVAPTLPQPSESGIDHIVVVMMENRSFDHFLGWLPGADGRQAGQIYYDSSGAAHTTHPLAPDLQGCGHSDPDHSYAGGRVEYNGGACDGWLRAGANDDYAIGYYTQPDLAFLGNAAPGWTACDHYFAAIMAETFPNRIYQHAAQTDRIDNTLSIATLPTIWDRLAQRGLRGRYYFSDVPFLALWGAKYLPIGRPLLAFLADCATGRLPEVAFVDPRFIDEGSGTSGDDHPHADIRNGEAFLNLIYTAVTRSPAWAKTVLVINYDEWGGFYDHVGPSAAPIPPGDAAAGNQDGLRGFRVPCLVFAPWARRGFVATGEYDHTSILKLIEWRWNLQPLTVRDDAANNLAEVLDFSQQQLSAPFYPVPFGPFGTPCPPSALRIQQEDPWVQLQSLARSNGWSLPYKVTLPMIYR
jgi:phospholipase C